ncbi:DUF5957 family protein [Actinomadura rudentiformis]|uniref:Uncharacterized protein n=1 Tax=Actinomadura rudentiformis TaxID=359158 RepID=A0A6H9YDP7_9ACTN|nr:DUF5957 family protein [Actinomadura rudentiformis]KAB2342378.1 hypothetical protein F8566_38120 [Actinomadura rudentiformis]
MRTVAAVLLGLIAGLFAGFALEVLIGAAGHFLLDGPGWLKVVAIFPPLLAVAGAVAGPFIDRRVQREQ